MPVNVLFEIPDNVTDEQAVFVEPLAAACEITEQLHIQPMQKVVVLGDGIIRADYSSDAECTES